MSRSEQKKIIIANSHFWGSSLKIGAEHLAEQFHDEGWDVLFLSSPLSPLHIVHPRSRKQALRKLKMWRPIRAKEKLGITLLCPLTLLPHVALPLFDNQLTLKHWSKFTIPPLSRQFKRLCYDNPELILFDNIVYWPLLKKLPGRKIYRMADRIERFPVVTKQMLALQEEILREVDLVVYTARDLEDMLDERSGPSLHLPNGVDSAQFSAPSESPDEYIHINDPIVLYMGALETWFDYDAVNEAILRLPDASFVFIGPPSKLSERIEKRANVHILGAKKHSELPGYVQHAALGLIPFNMESNAALLNSVCPLKLFEYLAGGLHVISYDSLEIRSLKAPVDYYAKDRPLHEVITTALDRGNNPEAEQSRLEFAFQSDWKSRYRVLQTKLTELDKTR